MNYRKCRLDEEEMLWRKRIFLLAEISDRGSFYGYSIQLYTLWKFLYDHPRIFEIHMILLLVPDNMETVRIPLQYHTTFLRSLFQPVNSSHYGQSKVTCMSG